MVDHAERVRLLLRIVHDFARVVITCRTQFFPKDEEIPRETGILKVGPRDAGEQAEYIFHKIYLSPFTDEQVRMYLKRRYPFWNLKQRQAALKMAQKIPYLTARPMLLAHINYLVQTKSKIEYSFELYRDMVEAWIEREQGFIRNRTDMRRFSGLIAVDLYLNRQARGAERITRDELLLLAKQWNISIDPHHLSSRSLLNRDARGNYKFAHRSIMEYLFITRFIDGDFKCCDIEWTDQMNLFLWEILDYQLAHGELFPLDDPTCKLANAPLPQNALMHIIQAAISSKRHISNSKRSLRTLIALTASTLRHVEHNNSVRGVLVGFLARDYKFLNGMPTYNYFSGESKSGPVNLREPSDRAKIVYTEVINIPDVPGPSFQVGIRWEYHKAISSRRGRRTKSKALIESLAPVYKELLLREPSLD
jgi:hypothetical protein